METTANPPPPVDFYPDPSNILLFLTQSFITNLFLFSVLFILFGMVWRKNIGALCTGRDRFMLLLLATVALITLLGSLIDLGLLYADSGYGGFVLRFNALGWGFALMLIFGSIYLAAHHILKIRRRVSILIGAGMTGVNLVYWLSLLETHDDPALITLPLLFVTPILLYLIYRWHLKVYTAEPTVQPAPEPEAPERTPIETSAKTAEEGAEPDIEAAVDAMER